jgi:serine/threonine protein kinase
MASQAIAALPQGTVVSGYRIVKKISSGGFSIVYLAEDEEGHPVAIKEYLPASLARRKEGELVPVVDPEHVHTFRIGMKCFFEEGRALARILHPNVVRVLNFFRGNDTVYMVMAYEAGRSLQEHIIRYRDRGLREIVSESFIRKVFSHVMNGLREVHTNKLLHLDLKPANVYLRMDGTPILLDFGAARQTLAADASKLYPMYTPGFAAPELYVQNSQLGPWTDIYSIGATIYACMAGMPPQPSDSRQLHDKMARAMQNLHGAYSDELIKMVDWCLQLDPLKRPQSVFSLQKALLENLPAARPAGVLQRIGRTVSDLMEKRRAGFGARRSEPTDTGD